MAAINAFAVKIYRPNYTRQLSMSANILGKYDNLQLQVYPLALQREGTKRDVFSFSNERMLA